MSAWMWWGVALAANLLACTRANPGFYDPALATQTGSGAEAGGDGMTSFETGGAESDTGESTTGDPDLPGMADEATCEGAAMVASSYGCRFAPIIGDGGSAGGAINPLTVWVANPQLDTAFVELYDPSGALISSAMVDPNTTAELALGETITEQWELPDASGLFSNAFQLVSDLPVAAYSSQPGTNASADASALIPDHAWGQHYLVVAPSQGPAWISVVGGEGGAAVTMRPAASAAMPTTAGGAIPALAGGDEVVLGLGPGEIARVYSEVDVSGFSIDADADVAVFVGSAGMAVPEELTTYRDLIVEQLAPRSTWGKEYAIAKFQPRGGEPDLYRVISDVDGNTVTVMGGPNTDYVLDAGQWVEFVTEDSVRVVGTGSLMIAHVMSGSGAAVDPVDPALYPGDWEGGAENCTIVVSEDIGDPSMTFAIPREQWRNRSVFVVPPTYAWDVASVVGPLDTWSEVTLDGVPLPDPIELPGGVLGYVYAPLTDGHHELESADPVGLEVYGYDCRVSYAFSVLGMLTTLG